MGPGLRRDDARHLHPQRWIAP